jgi:hypothetical protein
MKQPLGKALPYGIVPLGFKIAKMTDIDIKSIQKLQYLAICQGSNVPYTPVWGNSEVQIFKTLLQRILTKGDQGTLYDSKRNLSILGRSLEF